MNRKISAETLFKRNVLAVLTLGAALATYPICSSAAPSYQTGDIVEFTSFPEDTNKDKSVSKPLEWQILEIDQENGKMLLLSRYGIKASSYCLPMISYNYGEFCSYNTSAVNSAMNGLEDGESLVNFLSSAGEDDEDESVTVPFMDSSFFLLSAAEAEKYLKLPGDRILYPTPAMLKTGSSADLTEQGYGWWWLRSDEPTAHAPFVDFGGEIHKEGTYVFHGGGLLRPAVWVDMKKFSGKIVPKPKIVKFGQYRQSDKGTQTEPVEWIAVAWDAKGNTLLVSRYGLDYLPFFTGSEEEEYNAWMWKTSAMRQYLNGQFFNTAFSSRERKFILEVQISSNEFIYGDNSPESISRDRIFLLNGKEISKYLTDYSFRNAEATPFAVSKIRKVYPDAETTEEQKGIWVLRERSNAMECYDGCTSMQIINRGHLREDGMPARENFVVRPAMWVSPGFDK